METLPGNMPHEFVVDLSSLDDLGKSIHVKDIKIPKGVELLLAPDSVIATVGEKTAEEEVAPVVAEEAAPAEAPKEEAAE